MRVTGRVVAVLLAYLSPAAIGFGAAQAQSAPDAARSFDSVEALDAYYRRQFDELETRQIEDLAALAAAKTGAEADRAYRELFQRAIDHALFAAADPAAKRCLADGSAPTEVLALATHVTVVAMIDQGKAEEALESLRAFLRRATRAPASERCSENDLLLGLGEASLQRLIRAKAYKTATELCVLLRDDAHGAAVKSHFEARLRVLKRVGAPAPPLEATDVEGRHFRPAGLKTKVVLVHFWATWCPPSVAAFSRLNALAAKYGPRGFEIVGINLDAHHEDVPVAKTVLPMVRHVLVEHGVTWPNLLSDDGREDLAQQFGVSTIPQNFLVGRDGTVIGVELPDGELQETIEQALAKPKE